MRVVFDTFEDTQIRTRIIERLKELGWRTHPDLKWSACRYIWINCNDTRFGADDRGVFISARSSPSCSHKGDLHDLFNTECYSFYKEYIEVETELGKAQVYDNKIKLGCKTLKRRDIEELIAAWKQKQDEIPF